MMNRLANLLQSPSNWSGLALATVALAPQALGWPLWGGWVLPPLGYAVGFAAAGLWFGWPKLRAGGWEEALEFEDQGDARLAMASALEAVQRLVSYNPEDRLSANLQARLLELCTQLHNLLQQWDRSKGALSLEENFLARHIVLRYLPDAIKTYLSIPPRFARSKVLANGKTAEDTLRATVEDLSAKVLQLTEDLAAQDAEAFLSHSRFLEQKFRPAPNPVHIEKR
jgi:hypothetical protein